MESRERNLSVVQTKIIVNRGSDELVTSRVRKKRSIFRERERERMGDENTA